ncbi:hypothetical protein V5799_006637 [Amblyomma americanum]|uniref:Secreted protein n=1 Tax=Amblyomma americanum TaxID=6943 RepID=A0AAQ4DVT9_AMBAM
MTSTKLLSFALVAVTIIVMMGRCSAYGDDVILQCPRPGRCYIRHDGYQEGCPKGCGCISDGTTTAFALGGAYVSIGRTMDDKQSSATRINSFFLQVTAISFTSESLFTLIVR